ncbi:35249_t:CDS:1, partial [Gigaspora margarita]
KQLQITEETADLAEAEIEIDEFTDSEKELYPLTKGKDFTSWKN